MNTSCKICFNAKDNSFYDVKEMLIGYHDNFLYVECSKCGCLQIVEIPEDMSKYYPKDYGSYVPIEDRKMSRLLKYLYKLKINNIIYYYTKKGRLVNKILCKMFPEILPIIEPFENIFCKKILDVGCGQGELLKYLAASGFINLFGVDPYIEKDICYDFPNNTRIKITKCEIHDVNEKFDIIMFNHSLEHMQDQGKVFSKLYSILNDNGKCIIEIPTVSSYQWKKFRENWYALDAPRHFYLHSIESISVLCKKNGFKINNIIFNARSGSIQSKLYKKGWNHNKINGYLFSIFGIFIYIIHYYISKYQNRKKKSDIIKIYIEKA